MNFFSFFIGMKGDFIQSLLLVPVITLMWILSLQLHEKRKRRSYKILSNITMGFGIFTVLSVLSALALSVSGKEIDFISSAMNGISNAAYLIVLFGYYRIHNKADLKIQLVFLAPSVLSAVSGMLIPFLGNIICFLSVGVIFYFHGRKLGRGQHNLIGSLLFGLYLILTSITGLVPSIHGIVYMVGHILPAAAYTLLLINLLEHSMVIMQSSYVSAITDPLTGLFNRRYFTRLITSCIEKNYPVNVIFSDIDNFKKLNDTKGHKVGDEVLKQVATIFMEEVENIGVAGRYGGEEMVMLIQDPEVDMNKLTERMRERIEKETIATVSIGYRMFESGVAPEVLIKQADDAMYIAKGNGKNQVACYTTTTGATVTSGTAAVENGVGKAAVSHG